MVWERGITRLESGWAPSGWSPADLYRERLKARAALARSGACLPREAAALLHAALEELDRRLAAATGEDRAGGLRRELTWGHGEESGAGWRWYRRPDPVPWGTGRD